MDVWAKASQRAIEADTFFFFALFLLCFDGPIPCDMVESRELGIK